MLLNTKVKHDDPNLLFCLDNMSDDDEDQPKTGEKKTSLKIKKQPYAARSQNLVLFRRRMTQKKLLDLEESEREKLASDVFECDRFKDKSMFHFINQKQLVNTSDYTEPDFIPFEQAADTDYEQNYSAEAPSVHDLFDIPYGDIMDDTIVYDSEGDYDMIEFLEDDEEMEPL